MKCLCFYAQIIIQNRLHSRYRALEYQEDCMPAVAQFSPAPTADAAVLRNSSRFNLHIELS